MSEPPRLRALRQRRADLADAMAPWWSTSVVDYSAALHRSVPERPIEAPLVAALSAELTRLGQSQVLPALLQHRVLATAHHVTPTNGPTFLALDAILTASGHPCVVGAYSGVAFSNTAWSGALSFSVDPAAIIRPGTATWRGFVAAARNRRHDAGPTEHRLSLIPSRWRDGLVYRHPSAPGLPQRLDDLQPAVAQVLASTDPELDWPTWALRSCESIQRAVLGHPIVYMDLNRVIADYLVRVLEDSAHPIAALLLEPRRRAALGDERPWFYTGGLKKKSERVELLRPQGRWLVGRSGVRLALEAGALQEALQTGRLCPGLMLCFVVLGVLNPLRCLGSFNQISYQAEFAARFAGLAPPVMDEGPVLLTGRLCSAEGPIYPLDRLVQSQPIDALQAMPMSQLWIPIVDRLLRAAAR